MGVVGVESKLTVDRKKFIEWAIVDNPDLFTPWLEIKADLIGGGEFILEAQTIFDTYGEIPSWLVMEHIEGDFVDPNDCVLSLIPSELDDEHEGI
jgi:hypothetical protein